MNLLKIFRKLDLAIGKLFKTGFENCIVKMDIETLLVNYNEKEVKHIFLEDIIEIKYDQDLTTQETSYPVYIVNTNSESIIIPSDAKGISKFLTYLINLDGYNYKKNEALMKIDSFKPILLWSKF